MVNMSKEFDLKINTSFSVVRPGDKLVIGFGGIMSEQDADDAAKKIAEKLPGVEVIIIDQCTSMMAYRPDENSHPPYQKIYGPGDKPDA